MKPVRTARLMTAAEQPERDYPQPQNTLDKLRADALATTGGRATIAKPMTGRCDDFPREAYVRGKTNLKRPEAIVPTKTGARYAAGPPLDTNLTQLTSDEKGQCSMSEIMHGWFGHSCGCDED